MIRKSGQRSLRDAKFTRRLISYLRKEGLPEDSATKGIKDYTPEVQMCVRMAINADPSMTISEAAAILGFSKDQLDRRLNA